MWATKVGTRRDVAAADATMCKHNIESIFVQQYQGLRSLFNVNCVVGNRLCNVDLGLAREVEKCVYKSALIESVC